MELPPNETTKTINKTICYLKYKMSQDTSSKGANPIKVIAFEKTTELGKIIGSEGTIHMLNLLSEQPRQYKDIEMGIDLPKTTLVRRLNSLQLFKIIKKDPFIAKGRKTHLYSLTKIGSELMRFTHVYERTVTLPSSQQKIIEVNTSDR